MSLLSWEAAIATFVLALPEVHVQLLQPLFLTHGAQDGWQWTCALGQAALRRSGKSTLVCVATSLPPALPRQLDPVSAPPEGVASGH